MVRPYKFQERNYSVASGQMVNMHSSILTSGRSLRSNGYDHASFLENAQAFHKNRSKLDISCGDPFLKLRAENHSQAHAQKNLESRLKI